MIVAQCRKLRVLRLGHNNLESGAISIARALLQNGNIEELDLSFCNIQETQEICECLTHCPKLAWVNLSGNKALQMVALAESLSGLPNLRYLNLRGIPVPGSERACIALVSALEKCTHCYVGFRALK